MGVPEIEHNLDTTITGRVASPSGLGLRRRMFSPRVRRATAEFSVLNPHAPKAQQVRRVILWSTLFSVGLFASLLIMVVATRRASMERLEPKSDAQLLEQIGANTLARDQRVKALEEIGRRRLSDLKNTPVLFDSPEVRVAFAKAAAQIGELALVPALMHQLDDESALVRSASAQALGVLGDKRTAQYLIARVSRESDKQVREKMNAAIGAMTGAVYGASK